jgi:hypothetical protein
MRKPYRLSSLIEFAMQCPVKLFMGALLGLTMVSSASAGGIITPLLSSFDLVNISADGTVVIAPDGLSFVLTGGNTGSGLSGTTDFTATAPASGLVQFQYSYASLDTPGADNAGYLLDDDQIQLADTDGTSGNASFSVSAGQRYGWWVNTEDNTGEPGVLTVAFPAPVPEPESVALIVIGLAVLATVKLIRTRGRQEGNI